MLPLHVLGAGHTAGMGTDPLDAESATYDGAQSEDLRRQAAHAPRRAIDERDRAADAREAAADRREAVADEREALADKREALAGAWQDKLAAWERRLDIRSRAAGESTPSVRDRSYEQIVRCQGLLSASQERLERSEAALRRANETDLREQDVVNREIRVALAQMAMRGPTSLQALQTRADRLREQATAAVEALAEAEDAVAREHERRDHAQQTTEHRQRADRARTAADTLRTAPPPHEDEDNPSALPH